MNMKLRLLAAFAVLGMTPYAMTGCGGTECGEGTTEQDGQCVAPTTGESITCADGTTLNEGKCEADISDCGDGTSLVDGACVADEGPDPSESCGSGTQYDEGVGACVPTSTIECGDGTVEQDGSCVAEPQDSTCQAGTKLADDGSCVVDMAACGDKTQLDPNSNTCLATDEVCGANTAYDADSDSCVPTDAVCDAGTVYSMETGLCLPEATCKAGDVILNGNCVSPVEEAIANADFTSQEAMDPVANNDDVLNGGTANALTIPAMGTVVVAGEIGTPVDLDGDTRPDQDVDAYTFTATAGQTLQVAVQPAGGPSLSFVVVETGAINALTQEEFFVRFSTFGFGSGASREIVIPADGDYTILVAPSIYLANGFEGGPSGDNDWKYALRVEDIAPFTATDIDTSAGPITGEFANLSDNLFKLTNITGGLATFTIDHLGEDVGSATLQIRTANGLYGTFTIDEGDAEQILLPQGDVYFFFDWTRVFGQDTSFEVSVTPAMTDGDLGTISPGTPVSTMAADYAASEVRTYTIATNPGEFIEFSHTNTEGEEIDVTITDSFGNTVFSGTFFDVVDDPTPSIGYFFAPDGGPFVVTVENNSSTIALTNEVITFNALTPTDLGMFGINQTISTSNMNLVGDERREHFLMTLTDDVVLGGTYDVNGAGSLDIRIYDAVTGELVHQDTTEGDMDDALLRAGVYVIEIEANTEADQGYYFDLSTSAAPTFEAEPNETDATATMVAPGSGAIGSFTAGDVDVFSVNVPMDLAQGDVWFVYLAPDAAISSTRNYTCTVRDSAGNVMATETSTNDCGLFIPGVMQGDYFIEVSTDSTTTYDYSLATLVMPNAMIETEPNADSMTATPWDVTTRMLGSVGNDDTDDDWFSFTVPQNIQVDDVIEFEFDASESDPQLNIDSTTSINISVYSDPMAAAVTSTTSFTYPKTASIGPNLTAGETYFVKVSRTSTTTSYTGRYYLDADVVTPPPVVMLQGSEMCMGAPAITMSGTYLGTTSGYTDDYNPTSAGCTGYQATGTDVAFTVTLAAGQTLDASLTGSHDTSLYLVSDCSMVTATCVAGDDTFGSPESISYTSAAGETLYLIVDGYSSSGTYELTTIISP